MTLDKGFDGTCGGRQKPVFSLLIDTAIFQPLHSGLEAEPHAKKLNFNFKNQNLRKLDTA